MKSRKIDRLLALEGLRGIAAIIVVFHHVLLTFYPYIFVGLGTDSIRHSFFEPILHGNPFMVFLSGTFAVAIFFVLSGFVLSVGYFSTGNEGIVKRLAAKRYLRLMIPALASVIIAWLLISLGLSGNGDAAELTKSQWLYSMWDLTPSFFGAVGDGLWGIFAKNSSEYNPVLWTMSYEFMGSFLVFGTLLLFGKNSRRALIYSALVLLTFQTWFLGFVIGMVLADLYVNTKAPKPYGISTSYAVILLLGGLFLGGWPIWGTLGSVYESMSIPFLSMSQNESLFLTIGAGLVVVAALALDPVRRLLEGRRISSLGRYTFSLYLVHKLALFTVGSGLFVWLMSTFPALGYNKSVVVSVMVTLPIIGIMAWLFERYIDAPAIRFSGVFADWLLGPRKEPSQGSRDR